MVFGMTSLVIAVSGSGRGGTSRGGWGKSEAEGTTEGSPANSNRSEYLSDWLPFEKRVAGYGDCLGGVTSPVAGGTGSGVSGGSHS